MAAGSRRRELHSVMTSAPIRLDAFLGLLADGLVDPIVPGSGPAPLVVVDLDGSTAAAVPVLPDSGIACVIAGVTTSDEPDAHPCAAVCDVVLHRDDPALDSIARTVTEHPIAATALAVLLRGSERRTVDDGLLAESATYSTLQAGPESAAWRAARHPKPERDEPGDAVAVARDGARLEVTLARPHVHNALNTAMRDELTAAFRLAALDPSITEVHLRGDGPSFCAGGDLDEFGSFGDAATAHLVRLQQSAGRAIHAVAERTTAHLHGACMGSGIELPAFAGRVVADGSTTIGLPEVSLGLVPGAGGTVSLPRRIGRHRTARLALTGERIDTITAHRWGLVDEIEDRAPDPRP